MKNILVKSIISLTAICSMVISPLPIHAEDVTEKDVVGYAEETVVKTADDEIVVDNARVMTEAEKNTNSKMKLLQGLGIMKEYTQEDIMKNANVTRAEFISMIYAMYNGKIMVGSFNYNDVDKNSDYADALGALTSAGIVHGDDNNNFKPDDSIKGVEMVKIVVSMLGYEIFAEQSGGYYAGYLNIANSQGLTKGVAITEEATFSNVVRILYNALDCNVAGWTLNGDISTGDMTFGEYWLDFEKGQGYVSGNEYSGTLGAQKAYEGYVIIGNKTYKDSRNIVGKYLGYEIEFGYTIDDDDEYHIVYAEPANGVEELKISSEDIFDATQFSLEYTVNEKRNKKVVLSDDVTVIYNGVEFSAFTADFFKSIDGEFIAVSNSRRNEYDTLIIKDYEFYVVKDIKPESAIITDMFGRLLDCTLDDNAEEVIWQDINGNPYNIENLVEYDVLAVEKDINEEIFFRITVFPNYAVGDVTGWYTEEENDYIVIDGIGYKISEHYFDRNHDVYPINKNAYGSALAILDINGNVIMLEITNDDSYKMGVLIKIINDEFEDSIYAKIYESTSNSSTFRLSKKLRIDGTAIDKRNSYESAINLLKKGDIISYTGEGELVAPTNDDFVWQVIRYTVNQDGEIAKIDTAAPDKDGSVEQLINVLGINTSTSRGAKMNFKASGSAFNKIITVGSAACWYLPAPCDYDDLSAYKFQKPSFSNDTDHTLIAYATKHEGMQSPSVIVLVDQFKAKVGSTTYMFDKAKIKLNDDDEPVVEVDAWEGKKQVTLCSDDLEIFKGYEKGDIFTIALDAKGNVTLVRMLFDMSEEKFYNVETEVELQNSTSNNPLKEPRWVYAPVYDINGTTLRLSVTATPNVAGEPTYTPVDPGTVTKSTLLELHNTTLFSKGLCMYNVYDGEIKVATVEDIRSYKSDGSMYSKVVAGTSWGESTYMYIYNYEE